MKKLFAVMMIMVLLFTLCSCKKDDAIVTVSSSSESYLSSMVSDTSSDTLSDNSNESENTDVSSNISSDAPSDSIPSTPTDDVSSEPAVEDVPNDEHTENEIPKEEPINFVPNTFPASPGSDEKVISLSNKVFYNKTRYAYTFGKNNGVDCGAIITVDADRQYLNCIALINSNDNERGFFSIYNDRIYYLKCIQNDSRDYKLIENLQIWSMNLSGGDKKQEKEINVPFTHIFAINGIANSKYLILPLYNGFNYACSYYRYDVITKEIIKINTPEFDEGFYINNNQLFVYDSDHLKFYKFDIDFGNKQLIFDVSNITSDYVLIDIVQDGFIFTVKSKNSQYFLDLSGNLTKQ